MITINVLKPDIWKPETFTFRFLFLFRFWSTRLYHFIRIKDILYKMVKASSRFTLRRYYVQSLPSKNGINSWNVAKVGSPGPEQSPLYSDTSDNDELSERLREMDISDLLEQRDVFTRQIATSLVTLHQLNQELDRRRRRKSYKNFRRKDATTTPSWPTQQNGNYRREIIR